MERSLSVKRREEAEWRTEMSAERRARARQRMFSIALENLAERGGGPAKRTLKVIRNLQS
jgi:hypothetical protein